MTVPDILTIASTVILSVGGGAAIVLGLSNWLGKVWANRLMIRERADHQQKLEQLRSDLERDRTEALEGLKRQLDVAVAHHMRETQEKLNIYRASVNVVAELLADLDQAYGSGTLPPDASERFDRFNRGRMKAYGHMAMLAPQPVMDAFDALTDHCILISTGRRSFEWDDVRELTLKVLNEIRKDVGIDKSPIEYKGEL